MSILQRRMFSNGGEATIIESRRTDIGTGRNPVVGTVNIEKEGEIFYQRVRKSDGSLQSEKIIDVELSPTRNPAEAANIQNRNQAISTTADFVTAAPALVGGLGALGFYGAKQLAKKGLGKKISDYFFTRNPSVQKGKYGGERLFAGTGSISGLTGPGIIGGATLGGALLGGALRSGIQDPVDLQEEIENLNKTKGKGRPMGETFGKKKEEPKGPPVIGFEDQPLISKVISSPDFNRFLSNLSSSLTATGSIAQGGAKGASDSFEEKLTSVDEVVGLKTSDAERNRNVNELLSNQLDSFNRTEINISKIDYVLSILDDDATGFRGLLGQAFDSVNAFFGGDIDKEFAELSARERADKLLLALRQQDIRAILGESGRTISNLDREIVADIFGDITMFTPAPSIRRKLNDIRDQYADRLANNRNEITASVGYFKDAKMPSDVVQKNVDNILRISNMKNFRNYMPPKYDPDKDRNMIQQSPGSITDVEYVEGT